MAAASNPQSDSHRSPSFIRQAVSVPESELQRWRKTFDSCAKLVGDKKCVRALVAIACALTILSAWRFLDPVSFVNAIAPRGNGTKIDRAQYATLFRVADISRRGLVSWDEFVVFETLLKRPDADYWIAFQYFDVFVFYSCLKHPRLSR